MRHDARELIQREARFSNGEQTGDGSRAFANLFEFTQGAGQKQFYSDPDYLTDKIPESVLHLDRSAHPVHQNSVGSFRQLRNTPYHSSYCECFESTWIVGSIIAMYRILQLHSIDEIKASPKCVKAKCRPQAMAGHLGKDWEIPRKIRLVANPFPNG